VTGNQRAAGEIVAEYLPSKLGQAVAVAHVGDEHCHLHHVAELAAGLFQGGVEVLKDLPHLSVEIAGERLAGIVHHREHSCQPHDLAAIGDHRLGIAALLRTFAFEELLGMQWHNEPEQQRRRGQGYERA
jgi:hypothetical protein